VMAYSTMLFNFVVIQFPYVLVQRIAVSIVLLLTIFKEGDENVFLLLTGMCHI
jgi:hypothetical protein